MLLLSVVPSLQSVRDAGSLCLTRRRCLRMPRPLRLRLLLGATPYCPACVMRQRHCRCHGNSTNTNSTIMPLLPMQTSIPRCTPLTRHQLLSLLAPGDFQGWLQQLPCRLASITISSSTCHCQQRPLVVVLAREEPLFITCRRLFP